MAGLPFDDRDGSIWFNGKITPWREAKVHVLTHGLHYGSGVFEGIRAYGGKIFKLKEHAERLVAGAAAMDMKCPYTSEEIAAACEETVRLNNIGDGYLRPLVWRGAEQMGVAAQGSKINCAVAAWEWPRYFSAELHEKGISLVTSKWRRPAPDTAPVHVKATGLYMICTLSKHHAESLGFNDSLMLDYRGYVAEMTGANLFFVKDGALHTPVPDCFLDGITRRTVIELARQAGLSVTERIILPEELKKFDECFATGTAAEVTPVGRIDDITYTVGPVTRKLSEAYGRLVRASATVTA